MFNYNLTMVYNNSISEIISQIAEVAGYLWERGWAERNGGTSQSANTAVSGKASAASAQTAPNAPMAMAPRRKPSDSDL